MLKLVNRALRPFGLVLRRIVDEQQMTPQQQLQALHYQIHQGQLAECCARADQEALTTACVKGGIGD